MGLQLLSSGKPFSERNKRYQTTVRRVAGCCFVLMFLALAVGDLQAVARRDVWAKGGKHPVSLPSNVDASKCSECHSDIGKGKYVHSAMAMGCTTCHQVDNQNGTTQIVLVSPVTQLCITCHALASEKILHGPYKSGDCVVCHSPHASDYLNHTWVSAQDICVGCHAAARLKVNRKKGTATVPWGITLTLDQMKGLLYLGLNSTLTANHPVEGHPVSGPNTAVGPGAPPISCLSCHKPHASNYANLLPKTPPDPAMKLCKSCSLCVDCHKNL
jgi:predicted CXXCH cytochrome family protein